jgi:16S rRNA (adenine1518-N6/adenine1519-N6)-dimethyltransferase
VIRASKRFGQHFLEPVWVAKVIRAIDPQADETFIEIGAGRGALTMPLLERTKAIIAFEIDRDLAALLRAAAAPGLTVVEGDFLESTWLATHPPAKPLRVAGNLPYNAASPMLFALARLYAGGLPIRDATLMLQREVADRLVADAGTREYGALSIRMQHVATVEPLLAIPPGAFRPVPKVHSMLVRIRYHAPQPEPRDPGVFESLVHAVFTRRRKTLQNALRVFTEPGAALAALEAVGIDGRRRPETLSVAELVRLADAFSSAAPTGEDGRLS